VYSVPPSPGKWFLIARYLWLIRGYLAVIIARHSRLAHIFRGAIFALLLNRADANERMRCTLFSESFAGARPKITEDLRRI